MRISSEQRLAPGQLLQIILTTEDTEFRFF